MVLREMIEKGEIGLVGAMYNIGSGSVTRVMPMYWIRALGGSMYIAGVLLVLVGLLLVTDYLTFLSTYLQRLTPEFLRSRL